MGGGVGGLGEGELLKTTLKKKKVDEKSSLITPWPGPEHGTPNFLSTCPIDATLHTTETGQQNHNNSPPI